MPRPRSGDRDFKAFLLAWPWWDDLEIERDGTLARQVGPSDADGTGGNAGTCTPSPAADGGTADSSPSGRTLSGG